MPSQTLDLIVRLDDQATHKMSSLGTTIGGVGTAMAGLGVAAVGVGVLATGMANDFNAGMANVGSLIPGNTERVEDLKSAVQDLAVETGSGTGVMAEGLYQVISAFGDTADTVTILEINAKAAAAGVATAGEAIAITSAVTKGYGDTSAEAVQAASDLAITTVRLGQTTFPELAASIGAVTPLAAELGVTQEELFGVMATGSGVTGSAGEVATQFRGILQSLMAPTASMTDLISDMGYASGEAMLQDLGLQGALEAITGAAEAAGVPLQDYIGSIEGQTLAMSLAGPQADTLTSNIEAMAGAAGATDAAFDAQTEGVNAAGFAMEQAKVQAMVLGQNLGDVLGPAVLTVIDSVMGLVDAFKEGGLGGALDYVWTLLQDTFNNIIVYIQAQLPIWIETLQHWGRVAWLWLEEAIPPLLAKAGELAAQLFAWVQAQLPGWIATLQTWTQAAWTWLQDAIPPLLAKAGELAAQLFAWIQGQLPGWIATLLEWGNAAWNWLAEAIPPLLERGSEMATQLMAWIQARLPGWMATLLEWGNAAWEWLQEAIPPLLARAGEMAAQLLAYVAAQLPGWIAQLLVWGKEAYEWLAEAIPPLIAKAGEFLATLITWAATVVLPALIAKALEWARALYEWVRNSLIPGILPALADFLGAVLGFLGEMVGAVAGAAANIGQAVINGIAGAISAGVGAVADAARGVASAALDAAMRALGIRSPSKVFADMVGLPIVQGLAQGISDNMGLAEKAVARGVGGLASVSIPTLAPAFAGAHTTRGGPVAGGFVFNNYIDARGAAPGVASDIARETQKAVDLALRKAGIGAASRIRTRTGAHLT